LIHRSASASPDVRVAGRLALRMALAGALVMLIVAAAFAVLLFAIGDLRDSTQLRRQTRQELVAANQLELLVVDLETGLRGFLITRDNRFLEPWNDARVAMHGQAAALERTAAAAEDPVQMRRARQIVQSTTSYLRDYSLPLVNAARYGDSTVGSVTRMDDGRRRVDSLRLQFDAFVKSAQAALLAREAGAEKAGRRAIAGAAVGIAGSILLILLVAVYLTRLVVRPIRRAAFMADRLAEDDLGARVTESGVGDIGALERSLNLMAGSLQASRAELAASRARIVAAGDDARRRIERDLHDGAQQRLVSAGLRLRTTASDVPPELVDVREDLAGVGTELKQALEDLRELSRGIHPAILSEAGLAPALAALARRSAVPVALDVRVSGRLPEPIEVAAYYVISEALANTAKHARASVVRVDVEAGGQGLLLAIRDDGVGGAEYARGSGLIGLRDRVEAIGGTIVIDSPERRGTAITAELPLDPSIVAASA
jgi:signal transduction histidine kinase